MGTAGSFDVPAILKDLDLEVLYITDDRAVMRCPLAMHEHDDAKPGFSVLLDSGRWICFKGCGGPEPLETLVRKVLGGTVNHATQWLTKRGADISLEGLMAALTVSEPSGTSDEAIRAIELDYDRQSTTRTSQWILDRGFTPQTLRSWGVRYDPIVPAIVIPIFSFDGTKLVGLQRRELVPGTLPGKYFTSPGYDRDSHLYGAWRHPRTTGYVIVVEGPLDAMWLHQNGLNSTVALLGTHCSRKQEKLIARLGRTVYLNLDNDEAGERATAIIAPKLRRIMDVQTLSFPPEAGDAQDLSVSQVEELAETLRRCWGD